MWDKTKWLWRYYRKYLYVLAVLIFLTPVQRAMAVIIPLLIEYGIDFIKLRQIPDSFGAGWVVNAGRYLGVPDNAIFPLTIAVFGFTATLLYSFVQAHRAWMNTKFEWLFRQGAFEKTLTKGPDFFNKFRVGDLITRMTDDVADKLSWFACSGIFRCYEALLTVIFTVTVMASKNITLTLWSAVPLPLLVIIFFKSSSALDHRYETLQKKISKFNDLMEACFSGIRVVKAYVQEAPQKERFRETILDRRKAEISSIKSATVVHSLYMYIWQFAILIVLLVGGLLVIDVKMTSGELIAYIYYVVSLTFSMFDIGQFLVKSRQSAISVDRLEELEKVRPMVDDSGNIPEIDSVRGHIEINDLGFNFPGSERQVIDNVSCLIKPGERVAFVGRVGSGKSWLINLLPRLVDPVAGSITLDGRDIREFKLDSLRRIFGYVPQEPVLFSDTIRNNIVFGRDNITDAHIDWAIELSQLKSDIDGFPLGLETKIGTRGMSISGGQKQRLALARALAGRPKILILDDCTSALDAQTEAALWRKLDEALPGMTVILITHRPDTLEGVDRIYVMENGRIIESGNHAQLTESGGPYAKLYKRYRLEQAVS
jgi:ATP-binding cassette, subfamily B, multidrug efflux pump